MNLVNKIKKQFGPSSDYIYKEINIKGQIVYLIFSEVLTNTLMVDDFILKRLTLLNKKELKNLLDILPDTTISKIEEKDITYYVNYGFVIIIYKDVIYAVEVKASLDRGITNIESEVTIKGSKDSFNENYNTNLGLIRRRIKSENLWIEKLELGRHTKTRVGIIYMNNIAEKEIIKNIKEKLSIIDIDGIIDSIYLKESLESTKNNFFPTIITTERPDKVCMSLLEGKVCILVDMSPQVIILPNFFIDFFHTVDDYYQKPINATFIRTLRIIAFIISCFLPAYFIAILTHNQNAIPVNLLLNLKSNQVISPFPVFIEAILMMISFEILKESDIRMSSTTGNAVSILGGLILGDALVNAGIVSPIMIIITSLSSISSLVFNEIEIVNAIRWWRFILIILSSFLGIYGIYIGFIIMLSKLSSLKSLGKPYLAPFSPFILKEQKDAILKLKNVGLKLRNPLLTKNKVRGKYK